MAKFRMLAPRSEKRQDILHLATLLPFNIWFPILLLARYFINIFLLGGINRLFRIHQHYSHCNIILRPHSLTSPGTERETGKKELRKSKRRSWLRRNQRRIPIHTAAGGVCPKNSHRTFLSCEDHISEAVYRKRHTTVHVHKCANCYFRTALLSVAGICEHFRHHHQGLSVREDDKITQAIFSMEILHERK